LPSDDAQVLELDHEREELLRTDADDHASLGTGHEHRVATAGNPKNTHQ